MKRSKDKPERGANPRSADGNPQSLVRLLIQRLRPYVPGEQPKVKGLIKLNTNENPYPASPKVVAAIQAAVDERLRLYPDPTAQPLREKLAQQHGCQPDNVAVGNGSDELLALASRAFVEPVASSVKARLDKALPRGFPRPPRPRCTVQYFTPSYSLYPVLADIHGAYANPLPLNPDFSLPPLKELKRGLIWDFNAALTYITTPNAPSGRGYSTAELEALCGVHHGVIVLDEAYADFADESALSLALKYPHVLVARTFSKAYSLCFQRVGYCVGHPELIDALDKIRDSYNVNGLGQVGALATLDDRPYYHANIRRIIATRQRLSEALSGLGFEVFPSQTNFILARPPTFEAQAWLEKLRERKILVRWWDTPEMREFVRITIGTDGEADVLVKAAKGILSKAVR